MVTAVSTFKNMIKFPAASAPGTGSFAVTAGANSPPYRDITNFTSGDTVSYEATDGSNQESGQGIATDNGGGSWTITRVNIWDSSNSGAAVNFTNAPTIKCDALAADLASLNFADGIWFGDGSDGDVTVSGSVTLTRDMYYRNLTLAAGAALNTASWRVFVQQVLDISAAPAGAIFNNGAAGNNASGATGAATYTKTVNAFGVPGQTVAGPGGNSSAPTGTVNAGTTPTALGSGNFVAGGYQGGGGGKGGDGSAGAKAGGAARASAAQTYTAGLPTYGFLTLLSWALIAAPATGGTTSSATTLSSFSASMIGEAGSSGGGATTTFSGGGGGYCGLGGGCLWVFARTIARGSNATAAIFQAKGGVGGTGGDGTGAAAGGGGGGGGGAGGFMAIVFRFLTGSTITNALDISGGPGGPGGNGSTTGIGGDQGESGAAGRCWLVNLATMIISNTVGTQTRNAGNAGSGTTPGSGQTAFVARVSL